jgi:hypothetical protein
MGALVGRWEADSEEHSLRWLALHEPNRERYGLRTGESTTIVAVARNLSSFANKAGVGEDEACRIWADSVAGLEHSPMLDSVVGRVSGIGIALFAYLRMRGGADGLKPDVRVERGLRALGFSVPPDPHGVLIVGGAVAAELGISRLVLDQLLW